MKLNLFLFVILLLADACWSHDLYSCTWANWWTSFDSEGPSKCDSSEGYVIGLYRNDYNPDDRIDRLEQARCCKAPSPYQDTPSTCRNADWRKSMGSANTWAKCPTGYFVHGLTRTAGYWINNIQWAKCCKPNTLPNSYEDCYYENVWTSFDKKGLSYCKKDFHYLVGLYRGRCNKLYCIEMFKCCKMYEDINECARDPCWNGATCVNTVGSYRCDCKSGFSGSKCQYDIDECKRSPCRNGATCVNLQGSYRCDCKSGFSGSKCQSDIPECNNNPCRNGATCVDFSGRYRCDCKSGYSGKHCETGCGTMASLSRIAEATRAQPGAWPWQVTFDNKKDSSCTHCCGGSIVAPQWIVTAAHCFQDSKDPKQYTVVVGNHNLNLTDVCEQKVPIEKIISHPKYVSRTKDYDLALVKLQSPLTYNNNVRPVCLPQVNFLANTNCYVTGWDSFAVKGSFPQILRQAQVPLVSRKTCQRGYRRLRKTITSRMLCAEYAQGTLDACEGDSGGPLVCPTGTKWYLTGIMSWGVGCGHPLKYGVYSDVMSLKKWVQDTTGIP